MNKLYITEVWYLIELILGKGYDVSELAKILFSIVGSIVFGGIIVFFLRHFTIKYFDDIDNKITLLKDETEKDIQNLKFDVCKKYEDNRENIRNIYNIINKHKEEIGRHDERIKNLEKKSKK